MDESEIAQDQYASFLLRLWRSTEAEQDKRDGDWQGEVEHIQSGRRCQFSSLEELRDLLRVVRTDSPASIAELPIA